MKQKDCEEKRNTHLSLSDKVKLHSGVDEKNHIEHDLDAVKEA